MGLEKIATNRFAPIDFASAGIPPVSEVDTIKVWEEFDEFAGPRGVQRITMFGDNKVDTFTKTFAPAMKDPFGRAGQVALNRVSFGPGMLMGPFYNNPALNGYLFDGAVGVGVGDYLEMSTPEKAEAYAGGKLYHFVDPDD
ncbi:hypothetical protein EsH8_IV_000954 [Colletotrichum jinshuiense]